jgi:cyclic pyranopterin phosphate synthase
MPSAPGGAPLMDNHGRAIRYLRVSITDRCNLRCRYCMPLEGVPPLDHSAMLTYEEIVRMVRLLAGHGVRSVRLTGGEPLARKHLAELVRDLAALPGVEDLALTTNGLLLERMAGELKAAGLRRVNVSLDTLRPDRFAWITRLSEMGGGGGGMGTVLAGIAAARRAGLTPVKINAVVMRGFNDDELLDFAHLAEREENEVRFIEFMPMGHEGFWADERVVTADEMRERLSRALPALTPIPRGKGSGPARRFRVPGFAGAIGFIAPLSSHFCSECNRLRLTADGKLRACLFSDEEVDLLPLLRGGAGDDDLLAAARRAVAEKQERHGRTTGKGETPRWCRRTMPLIGG